MSAFRSFSQAHRVDVGLDGVVSQGRPDWQWSSGTAKTQRPPLKTFLIVALIVVVAALGVLTSSFAQQLKTERDNVLRLSERADKLLKRRNAELSLFKSQQQIDEERRTNITAASAALPKASLDKTSEQVVNQSSSPEVIHVVVGIFSYHAAKAKDQRDMIRSTWLKDFQPSTELGYVLDWSRKNDFRRVTKKVMLRAVFVVAQKSQDGKDSRKELKAENDLENDIFFVSGEEGVNNGKSQRWFEEAISSEVFGRSNAFFKCDADVFLRALPFADDLSRLADIGTLNTLYYGTFSDILGAMPMRGCAGFQGRSLEGKSCAVFASGGFYGIGRDIVGWMKASYEGFRKGLSVALSPNTLKWSPEDVTVMYWVLRYERALRRNALSTNIDWRPSSSVLPRFVDRINCAIWYHDSGYKDYSKYPQYYKDPSTLPCPATPTVRYPFKVPIWPTDDDEAFVVPKENGKAATKEDKKKVDATTKKTKPSSTATKPPKKG